jgi:hypothetical protein
MHVDDSLSSHSLLNAMDGSIAGLNQSSFEQSLVLNLLFQEKVLVYDGLFFSCHNLLQRLSERPGYQSLFEVACRRGLIVPAFRNPNITSLRDSADTLKRLSPCYELPGFSGDRNRVIHAVDGAIESGVTRPFYWPMNAAPLGEGYDRNVRMLLQRDDPPEHIRSAERRAHFGLIWAQTKPLAN